MVAPTHPHPSCYPQKAHYFPRTPPMKKLLALNRSEIAIRIFRAATELGLRTVAIYSQEDRLALHRFKADEAYLIGEGKGPVEAYLDIDGIVALATEKGVDAIHPGYGFLSENPALRRAPASAPASPSSGPRAELLDLLGDKTAARRLAAAGRRSRRARHRGARHRPPTRPRKIAARHRLSRSSSRPPSAAAAAACASCDKPHDFAGTPRGSAAAKPAPPSATPPSSSNATSRRAKHIEVQILGDHHGNLVHLYERDCSVQRRHQKVVEVAPAVALDPDDPRRALPTPPSRSAAPAGYRNAGTVEFLVDADTGEWYFIEVNPRIQVEHTVTEMVTGIDLVQRQILVAQGHRPARPRDQPARAGRHRRCTATPSSAASPPRTRPTTSPPTTASFTPTARPPASASASTAASAFAGAVITPVLRFAAGEGHRLGPRLPRRPASAWTAPCASSASAASRPTSRSSKTSSTIPTSRPATCTTSLHRRNARTVPLRARAATAPPSCSPTSATSSSTAIPASGRQAAPTPHRPRPACRAHDPTAAARRHPPAAARSSAPKASPSGLAQQKQLLITDTTFRDAHQSLLATRVRTYDMLAIAELRLAPAARPLQPGNVGRRHLRRRHALPAGRSLAAPAPAARSRFPTSASRCCCAPPTPSATPPIPTTSSREFIDEAAAQGIDIFRIFDSLNWLPNMKVAMEAVREDRRDLRGRHLLHRRHPRSQARQVLARLLREHGQGTGAAWARTSSPSRTWPACCKPYAADKLVKALREEVGIPIHFHTHDTSGINAASILQGRRRRRRHRRRAPSPP